MGVSARTSEDHRPRQRRGSLPRGLGRLNRALPNRALPSRALPNRALPNRALRCLTGIALGLWPGRAIAHDLPAPDASPEADAAADHAGAAADHEEAPEEELTVSVQGTRAPTPSPSATTITPRQIRAVPRRTAEDALRLVPGMTL